MFLYKTLQNDEYNYLVFTCFDSRNWLLFALNKQNPLRTASKQEILLCETCLITLFQNHLSKNKSVQNNVSKYFLFGSVCNDKATEG